jgi:molecular chaperone Hsp33
LEFEILQEKPVKFSCNCSLERVTSMISAMEKKEVEAMLKEDKGAKVTCEFCNKTYELTEEDLAKILSNYDQ